MFIPGIVENWMVILDLNNIRVFRIPINVTVTN